MKVYLYLIVLTGTALMSAASGEPTADVWEKIDVVPMPKEIALTGATAILDPAHYALVVGKSPLRQSALGAEQINKRLKALGGRPLPIVTVEEQLDPAVTPIFIGTREDNPIIAKVADERVINVGEKNPGVRGYEIHFVENGPIYLAGADAIGALYACVTFSELLSEQTGSAPQLPIANIRDWPDIQYLYVLDMEPPSDVIRNPDSPDARKSYLEKLSKMYEQMLRRKLTMVWFKPLAWGEKAFRDMSPYARETVRTGIEAGKELGIESLYYHLYPFVGLRADQPDVDPALLEQKPKARYDTWLQSWSMDEERRSYARELAKWIKDVGFTDVGFHDTDTGGYLNPANWNNRGPVDQKRWGDDYAAATINKFQIFYEELIKQNPSLRVNLTLYPYNSEIFDPSEKVKADLQKTFNLDKDRLEYFRKRYESYWTQLNAAFPKKDVAFAIREPWSADGGPGLKAFLRLIDGRPLFAWYGLAAAEFYCNVPAWLGTLHSGSVDDIVFTQNIYVDKGYVPILSFAMREYSWNTKAPGAATFQTRDRAKTFESAAGDNTTKSYTVMLPHLVRNYFGRPLAPDITLALQANSSPFIVFGGRPDRNIIDETESRMKMESVRARDAATAMDAAWLKSQGQQNAMRLETEVLARVAYLRQVFHATALTASVKESLYRSQRLSSTNRFEEAGAAVQEGMDLLAAGETQLANLEQEGPSTIDALPFSAKATQSKTVPLLKDLLNQRKISNAASQRSGGVPQRILNLLARDTELPIVTVNEAPVIDGIVDDDAWKQAYPAEAWFQTGPSILVADAESRFYTVADGKNLYVAFKCWTGGTGDVGLNDADREFIRVYIKRAAGPPEMLAFAAWANGKLEMTDRTLTPVIKCVVKNEKGFWQGELQIPLSALGPVSNRSGCRIGFLRSYNRFGTSHMSATVPLESSIAGPFEDARSQLDKLPLAKWNEPAFQATARIRILAPKMREVTLDDRIATMVDFGVIAESDCVLDNIVVEAHVMDSEGKVESTKQLLSEPSMKYELKPNGSYSVTFLQAVNKGEVRLTLRADQAKAEVLHRIESPATKASSDP